MTTASATLNTRRMSQEVKGKWVLKKIPVRSISPSHKVEASRRTPSKYLSKPIHVMKSGTGYNVHDGNHRLQLAVLAGRASIMAYVWVT